MRGRRSLMVGRLAAVGAVVTAGALIAPAALGLWSTTRDVSADGWQGQDSPTVAVDRQGDRLLVWAACDSALPGCYFQVQARTMPLGRAMGPIRNLSPLGPSAAWPEVDSDDDGDAAVVWEQDSRVVARRVTASGALGELRTLSPEIGINPVVATSPGGTALVVWADYQIDAGWHTRAQHFSKDGSLGPLLDLGPGTADKPAIGIDRYSQAVVAWAAHDGVVARRVKPGSVSPLKILTSPIASQGGFGMVRVGVDRDGDAVITFRSGGGDRPRVWARRWTHSGTLGSVLGISAAQDSAGFHNAVATDLEGDSMLVWTRWNAAAYQTEVLGRSLSRTGAFGTTTRLGFGDRPDLALDDDGDGLVVWHSPGAPQDAAQVRARTISRAGAFGTARTLSSDGSTARADSSPTGRVAVVWQQRSYPYQIHAIFGP
jgi:hypothetical protein